jgi:pimeloyl-ACP methyl ester carboxylesterase
MVSRRPLPIRCGKDLLLSRDVLGCHRIHRDCVKARVKALWARRIVAVVFRHERVEEQGFPWPVVTDGSATEQHIALIRDGGVAFVTSIRKHLARRADFEARPLIVANIALQVTMSTHFCPARPCCAMIQALHRRWSPSLKSFIAIGLLLLLGALAYWLWTPDKDRVSLEARYLARPGDMIDVAGSKLHVRDTGPADAPAIILLHGFGASLQTWDPWTSVLQRSHRVIRLDLPGSGLSWPDPAGDYSDERSMQVLVMLQDRLRLVRTSVGGHSIGGRIAWTFAARHPERVDKLILVAPDGFASPGFRYGEAPHVPAVLKLMRYVLPRVVLRMNLAPAYASPASVTDALVERYHDLMLAPGSRKAMLQRMQQTVLVAPEPLLTLIRAPTLLVWGEQDAMIPFANAKDYLKNISDVRLAAYPDAGHLPQEEAAARSATAVRDFLDAR